MSKDRKHATLNEVDRVKQSLPTTTDEVGARSDLVEDHGKLTSGLLNADWRYRERQGARG